MPRVSVILPTYNRALVLGRAIQSVIAQTYSDWELIAVDDGSTDRTPELLASYDEPRIRAIRRVNGGVSAARNTGLREAHGEYTAFLDSDDEWSQDKLSVQVSYLDRHPDIDAVFADLVKTDGGATYPSFMRQTPYFHRLIREVGGWTDLGRQEMYHCLLKEVPVKTPVLLVRAAALREVGGFNERLETAEDWELLIRFARQHRFAYYDAPLATVHVLADSLHRRFALRDKLTVQVFLREEAEASSDSHARRAVRVGLAEMWCHMGWLHAGLGDRQSARRDFAHGFCETGDLRFLVRALKSFI